MGMLFVACHKKEAFEPETGFCINDSLMRLVKIDTAVISNVQNELRLTGKITFNEDQVVKVYPFVGGVIEDLKVELGDYVEKGQVLALIRSGEIVDFENQLVSAKSNLDVAKKNLQVADDMYKGSLASEKDLIMARNDVQKAESEYERIQKILVIYSEGTEHSIYAVKSPITGFVVEKNVTENMQFRSDNTGNLFTISNLSDLWAIANVYESDISKVKLDQEAIVTTIAYPEKQFVGKIDKIFNVLDDQSRVEKVKIKLTNNENLLKPEMFAYVIVRYPENKQLVKVPSGAIIFDKSKNYVLIYTDKCKLEIREVTLYKNIKGFTYVTHGLSDGELVISESQLLIYNALSN
jgi:cobalt-zinc-cadmium efflux system membrane fusion protein